MAIGAKYACMIAMFSRRTDINKVIGTDEGAPFDATVVAKAVYASPMNVEVPLSTHPPTEAYVALWWEAHADESCLCCHGYALVLRQSA